MPGAIAGSFEIGSCGVEDLCPVEGVTEDHVAPLADDATAAVRAGLVTRAAGPVVVDYPAFSARLVVPTDAATALCLNDYGLRGGVDAVLTDHRVPPATRLAFTLVRVVVSARTELVTRLIGPATATEHGDHLSSQSSPNGLVQPSEPCRVACVRPQVRAGTLPIR
jgi:hypothetical protein